MPQQGSPVSGSPGSRLISMSKWHCGRSCAPIATEAAARAGREGEEGGQVGSRGGGWGGAQTAGASRRPVGTARKGETGSPPPPISRLPCGMHTHAGELFTWRASSLNSSPCAAEKPRPLRPKPNAANGPPPPSLGPASQCHVNLARVATNTARAQSRSGWLTERKHT